MLSDMIKHVRELEGETQANMGERLGVAQRTIAGWESGGRSPKPDMIVKIADLYDVSTDYLLGRTENPHGYEVELREGTQMKEPPASKEGQLVAGTGESEVSFELPLDSLPENRQELERLLTPVVEDILRRLAKQKPD